MHLELKEVTIFWGIKVTNWCLVSIIYAKLEYYI